MYVEQLYTNCLSEAAYYIESNGEAAIIDPLRDIEIYIEKAKQRNATIKFIFETHFHADFVSGHIDLHKATGAPIVYGPETNAGFDMYLSKDGEKFSIGNLQVEVMHTPGHTMESTCYLLKDESGNDYAVFTGDTLFVGDVGRPDLAQKANEITMQDLAGMMYDSLQQKIMPLADHVIVYPAHGPGSSCGKNLGPNTHSTIGKEKAENYALQATTKEDFIKAVTHGIVAPPQYFPINAQINKNGYESLESVLAKGLTPLSIAQVQQLSDKNDVIFLDTRKAAIFTQGFVPGSISIGLEGRFAEWAGSLLSFDQSILLITEVGMEKESVVRLARVGFDKFAGHLDGGYEAWKNSGKPVDMIIDVEASELAMDIKFDEKLMVLDVRKENEFAGGHIAQAVNVPLNSLTDPAAYTDIEDGDNVYVHCAGGYRSVIAASMMKRQGIHNIRNILGGWSAIKELDEIDIEKSAAALNK